MWIPTRNPEIKVKISFSLSETLDNCNYSAYQILMKTVWENTSHLLAILAEKRRKFVLSPLDCISSSKRDV